jgi:hypothetical protein
MKDNPPSADNAQSIPFSTSEDAGAQIPEPAGQQAVQNTEATPAPDTANNETSLSSSVGQINPSNIVTIEGRKSGGFLNKLFPLLVLIMLGVWAWVGYIFFQNRQLGSGSKTSGENASPSVASTSPTPEQILYDPETIRISQGNIVIDSADGGSKTLINKSDYKNSGIIGFTKVSVSSDMKLICFESIPPATTPELYIADVEGKNVKKIGNNLRNCTWALDSKTLFYVQYLNGSDRTDIYKYDTASGKSSNLTEFSQTDTERTYNLLGLSADGSSLVCTYTESGKEVVNNCEINTETDVLDDL